MQLQVDPLIQWSNEVVKEMRFKRNKLCTHIASIVQDCRSILGMGGIVHLYIIITHELDECLFLALGILECM